MKVKHSVYVVDLPAAPFITVQYEAAASYYA